MIFFFYACDMRRSDMCWLWEILMLELELTQNVTIGDNVMVSYSS